MDSETIALLAAGALAMLAALTPIRIPLAVCLAMLVLREDLGLEVTATAAAFGGMVGRLLLAAEARRETSRRGQQARSDEMGSLRQRFSAGSGYPNLTFFAALTPIIPERFLFGVLGALRLPLRYAAVGALIGQYLILWAGTAIMVWLGRAVTDGDAEAAFLLGLAAAMLVVFRVLRRVDWDASRTDGRPRLHEEPWEAQAVAMFTSTGPGLGSMLQGRARTDLDESDDEDIIDVDVVEDPAEDGDDDEA